jgi:hypothetical protein
MSLRHIENFIFIDRHITGCNIQSMEKTIEDYINTKIMDRQTGRQTDRHTDKQTSNSLSPQTTGLRQFLSPLPCY